MFEQSLEDYIERFRTSKSISDCKPVPIDEITDTQDFLFVSYSHHDYKKVYEDLAVMAYAGVKFWYDEGLQAGKHWDEEVKGILLHPCCVGVIFFISENLFLSKSVNQEIGLVCDKAVPTKKPYFSVNLTDMTPSRIIRAVMRKDDAVLDEAGLDTERLNELTRAFSDRQTYISFSAVNHHEQLNKEIKAQFPTTISDISTRDDYLKRRYLVLKETGEEIPLGHSVFRMGRNKEWADYCLSTPFAGREHCSIFIADGEAWILDHDSTNGTRVNGNTIKRSRPVLLNNGDEISISYASPFIYHVEVLEDEWATIREALIQDVQLAIYGTTGAGKTELAFDTIKMLEQQE